MSPGWESQVFGGPVTIRGSYLAIDAILIRLAHEELKVSAEPPSPGTRKPCRPQPSAPSVPSHGLPLGEHRVHSPLVCACCQSRGSSTTINVLHMRPLIT